MPLTKEQKQALRDKRRERRAQNLCLWCGKPSEPKKSFCTACLRRRVEANRKYYVKNRLALVAFYIKRRREAMKLSLCQRCFQPLDPEMDAGRKNCLSCRGEKGGIL